MKNYRMKLQYDGTRYSGWQKQGNTENTIQGKLEAIFQKLTGDAVEVHGSGRTDAGVHARGQVANVKLNTTKTVEELLQYVNEYLPKDIAVVSLEETSMRFHSRLNAVSKTYCYRIRTAAIPDVFERNVVWQYGKKLDTDAMKQAAEALIGEHDFLPYCGLSKMKKSSVRRIDAIQIDDMGEEVRITITGNGFLYHMVRLIVGDLVLAGSGEESSELTKKIKNSSSRAAYLVPPQGLALMEVHY